MVKDSDIEPATRWVAGAPVVVAVDDDRLMLATIRHFLRGLGVNVLSTTSPQEALRWVRGKPVSVVVADECMPGLSGTRLLARTRELSPDTARVMVTGSGPGTAVRAINVAGVSRFLEKPIRPSALREAVSAGITAFDTARRRSHSTRQNREALRSLISTRAELGEALARLSDLDAMTRDGQRRILHHLAIAAEFRDACTAAHLRRIGEYATLLAESLGLDDDTVRLVADAAPMHDVGKLAIPDSVLLKPGKLTEGEWETMRLHTVYGARMLSGDLPLIEASRTIALSHHERWNGQGYPHGTAGEDIPLFGRLVAVVDTFDAITTKRVYQKAQPVDEAVRIMRGLGGAQLDPRLLEAFLDRLDCAAEICRRFSEEAEAVHAGGLGTLER